MSIRIAQLTPGEIERLGVVMAERPSMCMAELAAEKWPAVNLWLLMEDLDYIAFEDHLGTLLVFATKQPPLIAEADYWNGPGFGVASCGFSVLAREPWPNIYISPRWMKLSKLAMKS